MKLLALAALKAQRILALAHFDCSVGANGQALARGLKGLQIGRVVHISMFRKREPRIPADKCLPAGVEVLKGSILRSAYG